jgi:cysteine desulfurase
LAPFVYLDHNATTPVRPEALEAALPFLRHDYGNPSSIYAFGQSARRAVDGAREQVAALLGAKSSDEVVFTASGSEADVLGIFGAAEQAFIDSNGRKKHVVTSLIEHDAVRLLCRRMQARGFEITRLGVDSSGRVDPAAAAAALRPETSVVAVMHANNETGVLEPIAEIGRLCRERGVLLHVDAVQSAGKIPLDVQELCADMLAISGHKINAPKGVGALYVRRGVKLSPVVTGHQEKDRRGGTENVAFIAALGRSAQAAAEELPEHSARLLGLRSRLEEGVLRLPGAHLSSRGAQRLPNTSHFCFEGVDGHQLVVALDLEGVCASSGPACSAGMAGVSHVLEAMGVDPELASGALRVSTGWGSSDADIGRLLSILPGVLKGLREVPKA